MRRKVVIKRQDRIDYVIDGVCEYYGTTREGLMSLNRTEYNRRRMTIKLLKDIADVPYKDICKNFSRNSIVAASLTYADITSDLSPHCYGNKELKEEYKKLLKHLGL